MKTPDQDTESRHLIKTLNQDAESRTVYSTRFRGTPCLHMVCGSRGGAPSFKLLQHTIAPTNNLILWQSAHGVSPGHGVSQKNAAQLWDTRTNDDPEALRKSY